VTNEDNDDEDEEKQDEEKEEDNNTDKGNNNKDDEKDDDEKNNDKDDDDKKDNDKKDNDKKDNEKANTPQGASRKRKREYKKKVDIKQGEKDYKKWMNQLKLIKSSHGKDGIIKMDERLSIMIQEYKILLAQQGYDYEADAVPADQEVVNVADSDDDKEYIDLETVGN